MTQKEFDDMYSTMMKGHEQRKGFLHHEGDGCANPVRSGWGALLKGFLWSMAVAAACFLAFLMVAYQAVITVADATIHAAFEAITPQKINHVIETPEK